MDKGDRIAKIMARRGLCSRREAERLIEEKRVKVNGTVLETPAYLVVENDLITVDGKPLRTAQGTRLWRFYKPKETMTTHKDPEGRETVFSFFPKSLGHLISIGRLDYQSEGLLLLTNDGALSRHFELPETALVRTYRVRVFGKVDPKAIESLKKGITIEGMRYQPIEATLDSQTNSNAWLTFNLTEGKNREIRKIVEHLGLRVTRLIRTSYGPFTLGSLEPGRFQEISAENIPCIV